MTGLLYPLLYGFKYTNQKIPDQSGKVVLVTGGNTGIGYETCYELVKRGAKVYLAARSESRATAAIKKIETAKLKGSVEWIRVDLQDLASVKEAAVVFSKKEAVLDALYCNAGIMATPYQLTKDGIEGQIQTNHVSHFLLVNLLLPKLEAADAPRVVVTSSTAHNFFKADKNSFSSLESLNQKYSSTWTRYGQSKVSNILFANGMAERYPKILTNSCHPGFINTELTRGVGSTYGIVFQKMYDYAAIFSSKVLGFMLTPAQGALTQLYLGTSEEVAKRRITGLYYAPIASVAKTSASVTKQNADKLWQTTERLLADKGYALKLK